MSIADSNAIRLWLEEKQPSPQEQEELLKVMETFCSFVGKDPDEMVSECFKTQGGLNYKKRRLYSEEIERFTETLREEQRHRVQTSNVVRSFFIHNGVRLFAPAPPWIG